MSLRQDLTTTTLDQIKGNYVTFSFWFQASNDVAKAQIAVSDQYYDSLCHCYIGGWNYYESPWTGASTQSGSLAWTSVIARAYVSGAAIQAYVRVIVEDHSSSPYVSAYVDDAAMTLYDTAGGSSSYGTATLTFTSWKVEPWSPNPTKHVNTLSAAVSAATVGNYKIKSIELRMELEPGYDDCFVGCTHKTYQDGQLWVQSLAEGNDRNLRVNPADNQKATQTALLVGSIGVGIVIGVATDGLGDILPGAPLAVGAVSDLGTSVLFNWLGESLNSFKTTAYGPGSDYLTRVRWDYPSGGHGSAPPYVSRVTAGHDGLWVYTPGSGVRLALVTDITWGQPQSAVGGHGVPEFFLTTVGVTTLVGYIYA